MNWNYILIGVVAIAILLVIGYLVEKWGVFEDSEAADGAEQIDRQETGPETRPRIPIRDKPRQLPFELKVISFCGFAVVAIVGVYGYQLLRTGGPAEFEYTRQLQYAVTGLIGVAAGVAYRGRKDATVGEVHVVYESADGSSVESEETIHYDTATVRHQDDGSLLVQELRDERIFGLFRRRKLAGHDRELRADRPLGDIVTHEVHTDAVKLDDGLYEMRTQGKSTVSGGTNKPADYRYEPPLRLPYEKQVKQQEQMRKMRIEKRSMKAQLAEAHNQIDDLVRILENGEYRRREDLKSDMMDIKELVGSTQEHVRLESSPSERRRQVNGQGDIQRQNGSNEGEA